MTVPYLLQILLYELIDLVPNIILALIPFQSYMRLTKKNTVFVSILFFFLLSFCRILALKSLYMATLLSVLWIIFYLLFYFICIRSEIKKLLFVLLNILNYNSFVAIIYSYFAYHKFPHFSDIPYSLSSSVLSALVYLIGCPIMWLMSKKVKKLIEFSESNNTWRYLWLVPATFCLSYYYNLAANGGTKVYSAKPANVLFAVFYNLGGLFVTFLVVHLLDESNASLKLKTENYQLLMQTKQYENLKNRIEDARRARHDFRQNLAVIQSYLMDEDRDGLLQYFRQYMDSLPPDSPIVYCDDYALNALIVYYENVAREHHIQFEAEVEYPKNCCIADSDAAVFFGNLIENALDACMRQTDGKRFISLHIRLINSMLVVTLDNSYTGTIHKTAEGFLSSKSGITGIGISSIQKIAEKYKGKTTFEYSANVFHAAAMLNLSFMRNKISGGKIPA